MAGTIFLDIKEPSDASVESSEVSVGECTPALPSKRGGSMRVMMRHSASVDAGSSCTRQATWLSAALLVGGALAAVALVVARKTGHTAAREHEAVALAEMNGQLPCSLTVPNTKYVCREPAFSVIPGVGDLELCRTRCFESGRCSAWTLEMGAGLCSLFELHQDEVPRKEPMEGALSGGLPCGGDWIRPPGSLYCFALMSPHGYEKQLLKYILAMRTSLFACDAAEVYSNQSIRLSDEIVTEVVPVELHCESGGEFGTALNLDIFLAIWAAVFKRGTWVSHAWTVKVDPDAVFFPDRLRTVLAHHPEPQNGVYLNNCKYGMHGPIEVFSRNAVGAFQDAGVKCQGYFQQLCEGDCKWGEDIWVDQCLDKVLGVQRDNEWALLIEDHCDAPTPWSATTACDSDHVSFHPFKDVDSYVSCMSYSQLPATQVEDQILFRD